MTKPQLLFGHILFNFFISKMGLPLKPSQGDEGRVVAGHTNPHLGRNHIVCRVLLTTILSSQPQGLLS